MIRWIVFSMCVCLLAPHGTRAQQRDLIVSDSCLPLQYNSAYQSLDIKDTEVIDLLQSGIRAFYGDDFSSAANDDRTIGTNLSDGKMGQYTRNAMRDICVELESLGFSEPAKAAIDLSMEYGWLYKKMPNWPQLQQNKDFLERMQNLGPTSWLMLAGPKESTLRVLEGSGAEAGKEMCNEVFTSYNKPDKAGTIDEIRVGARTVANALNLNKSEPESERLITACSSVIGQGGSVNVLGTLSEYTSLDANPESGLSRLTDPGFASWWAALPAYTSRLLFGNATAVRALISLFQPINRQEIAACVRRDIGPQDNGFTYYQFKNTSEVENTNRSETDLSELTTQQFDSSEALVDAVTKEFGFEAGGCEYGIITRLIKKDTDRTRQFTLSRKSVDRLANEPENTDVSDALQALQTIDAPSLEELQVSVVSGVTEKAVKGAPEQIVKIADLAAQLAEAVPLSNDTAVVRGQAVIPKPESPAAYALTEQSMQQLLFNIQDPEIAIALQDSLQIEKSSRNDIRLSVMKILADDSARELEETVSKVQQFVQTSAVEKWTLPVSVSQEITSRPDLSKVEPVDPDELKELTSALSGISYINRRLFEKSLVEPVKIPLPGPDYLTALLPAQKEMLVSQSRISVNAVDARNATALATNCGCGLRRGDTKQIYSIHPFWKWSLQTDSEQQGPSLDFAYIDRIAFDGVLFDYLPGNSEQGPKMTLGHASHWYDSAESFTKTAHKFEAEVDLVFRIAGWENWELADVKKFAQQIADTVNFKQSDSGWQFPTPSYSAKPDGVALFFKSPGDKSIDPNVINLFFGELRKRLEGHQQITVGFDINLGIDPEPDTIEVFKGFSQVLLDAENNTGDDGIKMAETGDGEPRTVAPIDRVLVFLERPTTETKKTLLRLILGMPEFRGSNRAALFRKIVPVVPPEAHKELRRLNRNNDPVGADRDGEFKETYGQFYDDLVFFDDNFSGVGFWPALYENTPDEQYTKDIKKLIGLRYNQYFYTTAFGFQYETLDKILDVTLTPVCRFICPNRNALYTVTVVFSLVIAILLVLGLPTKFRQLVGRAINYTFASIVALLAAILICSQSELRLASVLIALTLATWKVYAIAVKPDNPLP